MTLLSSTPIEIPTPKVEKGATATPEQSTDVTYKIINSAVTYEKGGKKYEGVYADLKFTVEDQVLSGTPQLKLSNAKYVVKEPASEGHNYEVAELSFKLTAAGFNLDKDGNVTPASDAGGRSWAVRFWFNYSFKGYTTDKDDFDEVSVDYMSDTIGVSQTAPIPSANINSANLGNGTKPTADTSIKDVNTLDSPVVKYVADDKRKPDPDELKKRRDENKRKRKEYIKSKLKVIEKELISFGESLATEIAEPYVQYLNQVTEIKDQVCNYYAEVSTNNSRIALSYKKLEQLIKGGVDGSPGLKYITNIEESVINSILSFNSIYNEYLKLTINSNDDMVTGKNPLNQKDLTKLEEIKGYLNTVKGKVNIEWKNSDLQLKDDKSLSDNLSALYNESKNYKKYYNDSRELKWDDSSALTSQLKNFNTNVSNLVTAVKSGNLTLSQTVIDSKAAIAECKHLKELAMKLMPPVAELDTDTNKEIIANNEAQYNNWLHCLTAIDNMTKLLNSYSTYSKMGTIEFESVKGSTIYLTGDDYVVNSIPELKNRILLQLNEIHPLLESESLRKLSIRALAKNAFDDLEKQLNQMASEILGKLNQLKETISQVYESLMALFKTAPKSMMVPMASVITTPVGPAVHITNPVQIMQACDTIYAACQTINGLVMKVYDIAAEAGIPNNLFDPVTTVIDSIVSILLVISLIAKAIGGL